MIHLISMKIDIFILVADKSCFLAIEFKNSEVTEKMHITYFLPVHCLQVAITTPEGKSSLRLSLYYILIPIHS